MDALSFYPGPEPKEERKDEREKRTAPEENKAYAETLSCVH